MRMAALPHLGLGVSTEYGAGDAPGALDPIALRAEHPEFARLSRDRRRDRKRARPAGAALDRRAVWPATYHFLDVNLDEPEDFDPAWLDRVRAIAAEIHPAWLCGDAGLWHFGARERGHMLLLPPILTRRRRRRDGRRHRRASADAVGLEVLPENPPGQVYLGDLHLLDFFARVVRARRHRHAARLRASRDLPANHRVTTPRTGLDGFPSERIVELHVAGGSRTRGTTASRFVEDEPHAGGAAPTPGRSSSTSCRAPPS